MTVSRSRSLWIAGSSLLLAAVCLGQRRAIPESRSPLLYPPTYDECLRSRRPVITRRDIYHEGWIDLNKNGRKDVYEDSAQPEEKRLDDLIRQMTLEEKTVQLATLYGYQRVLGDYLPTADWQSALWKDGVANIDEHLNGYPYEGQDVPGAAFLWPASKHTWALNEVQRFFIEETRLGIPAEFTNEGIRGVEHTKATAFPTQLAQGPTWDRELIRQIGEVTGREAYALGYDNVYAPVLDVMRDPRWGRCLESYGEDPFLVSELGIEMVRGLQSQGVGATLKHFAVYANNKGAREGNARTDPQIAPREMETLHLWPWERVMRAANPLGVMSSYNDYDGVPITGSKYFLTGILRERMGFQGYVVSDSAAVENLFQRHRVAHDPKDAVRLAVLAGLNVRTEFSPPEDYVLPLRELVREGAVPQAVLDSRVRDVLRVKMREGLLDKPYRPLDVDSVVMSRDNLAIAQRASRESHANQLHPEMPATYNISFGVQRKIGFGVVLDLAYVGTLGRHLTDYLAINTIAPGSHFLSSSQSPIGGVLPDDFMRPYPGYNTINLETYGITSSYHALQWQVNRRFSHGLQFGAAFTWSRAMDYTDSYNGTVATSINPRIYNYGRAGFDRKFNLVFNYLWDLPRVSKLWNSPVTRWGLDNWQISGITAFISGAPCAFGLGATTSTTVACGSQQPGSTFTTVDGTDITGGGESPRTVLTCNPNEGGPRTFYQWFNTSCVHRPAQGTFGNAPAAPVIGPGTNNWSIALFKDVRIKEKMTFQLRVETYNTFNHTQFTGLNTTPRFDVKGNQVNSSFGQAITAANPRYMQFAVRVTF